MYPTVHQWNNIKWKCWSGLKVLTQQVKSDGGGEMTRRRWGGDTKEAGMQRVNLLKSPPVWTKGVKSGGGGTHTHKGWGEGEGGGAKMGVHSPTIWIYCFRNDSEGDWEQEEGTRRRERRGSGPCFGWSSKRLKLGWTFSSWRTILIYRGGHESRVANVHAMITFSTKVATSVTLTVMVKNYRRLGWINIRRIQSLRDVESVQSGTCLKKKKKTG